MDPSQKELKELIEGCKSGDRACQKRVYEMYYGKMMGTCLRYTRNEEQAKDILQDSFIKVFSNIEKFKDTGSFEGWIRRVVANTAIDFLRKKKNDHVLLDEDMSAEDFRDEEVDEADKVEEEEELINAQAKEVMEALQKLSPAYRTVFNLYVVENYSHKEIAEILDINIGTSKSNLAKAKKNLKNILKSKNKKEPNEQ